ncbi:Telomere length regulation protein TEL2 [Phytophthora citrophthora]|uniref:Telomere length regulation protein TEL2 n=1 Tax=Phytophthora citrophthora TaxID=4793 RepID=A0AAD9FXX9_9STRA|nr:Telomere length regulation protein TEL2 [Phytophthora citrophthora]KAK1932129.1 Telomere length regulation protein TEL2 [Phytophthora citrophthora]
MTLIEVQRLRAFVDAKKRSVEAAERRYDIQAAVVELRELAAPLRSPDRFSLSWKPLYLEVFYRDVAAFMLRFVAVHLENCFSERDREQTFDVFFDREFVPSSRAISALISTLSATKTKSDAKDKTVADDAEASIIQCVRLLDKAVTVTGVQDVMAEMLKPEQSTVSGGQGIIGLQVLISQLSSLPDLIYNRRQRDTPAAFRPRRYFPMLCDGLFHGLLDQETPVQQPRTFRIFADKLFRIGQAQVLVQSWLRSFSTPAMADLSPILFQSLPESCHEQILLQLAGEKVPSPLSAQQALCLPKYRLLAQIPSKVCANKHFQYVITHKLLLRKRIDDLFFWRVLVDVLAQSDDDPGQSPLATVFDVVLSRWSQSDFAGNTEYTVNASVCFFLRYSLQKLSGNGAEAAFTQQDWITKLCKGVQDHMSHSLERVRALGMRVGESLSHIIAAEKPLDFGLKDEDPITVYGCPVLPEELEQGIADLNLHSISPPEVHETQSTIDGQRNRLNKPKKRSTKPFILDPDELVPSDDDEDDASAEDAESESSFDDADSDSDSDISLEAYDLEDQEEDLKAKRPLYLKDLIAGLLSDDDREKSEAALNEAEILLRRQPRDLNDKAQEVARALLRLEDKYNTPQFAKLRSQALATTCAQAPTQILPYLTSQALEREQLLQSRIDVLQAMTSAAQEISERGGDYRRTSTPKTLLHEQIDSDLSTRTMQSLKTRRWGYRRDALAEPKRNAFAPFALEFFSPLLFGYNAYVRKHSSGSGASRSEVEQTFLAHLLHALASFVECAGHAPQTLAMAKCLLEFAWNERSNSNAEVRRQVLFSLSRVLLVVPPDLLGQEVGEALTEVAPWLHQVQNHDPDAGCREAAKLLSSFASMPTSSLSLM